jgi:hypothetical protein
MQDVEVKITIINEAWKDYSVTLILTEATIQKIIFT